MGRRKFGSVFPVARIKKMMQLDEDVGKIATSTPLLVSKALELIIEDLLKQSKDVASSRNTRTVTPQHMKQCVMREDTFDFLRNNFEKVPDIDDDPGPERKRSRREPASETAKAEAGETLRRRPSRPSKDSAPRPKAEPLPSPPTKPPQSKVLVTDEQKQAASQFIMLASGTMGSTATADMEDDDYDAEVEDEDHSGPIGAESSAPPGLPTRALPDACKAEETEPQRISVSSLLS